ncbi:hypothetical protein DH2020_026795 [Rehmannia glutinosa]|uniref:Flap endonuclease 1 n=1 Tax=Rehmannia glutinosa TaxID=99300 RepID=A0ABR0VYX6_REHGL
MRLKLDLSNAYDRVKSIHIKRSDDGVKGNIHSSAVREGLWRAIRIEANKTRSRSDDDGVKGNIHSSAIREGACRRAIRIRRANKTRIVNSIRYQPKGMFTRTIRLLEAGIKPVYVFDGKPPDLKKQELAKRYLMLQFRSLFGLVSVIDLGLLITLINFYSGDCRYSKRADATEDLNDALETGNKEDIEKFSKRTVKVTKQHNEDCKRLLRLMGVPVIEAPSEAEAQCAALCKTDKVYAVASEDMDSLTFGAPRFLRHLMDPSSKKIPVMEFEVSKVLEELNLTMDQFIDLCILSGCDYCDSIKGIGGLTALKLIRQHGSIENILENISKERYQIPDDWPYQEARRLFKEPSVFIDDDQLELKWSPPDEEAIEKIKAAKNKSSQGRLESFFKPVATASVPAKRKETTDKTEKESAKKKTKAGVVKKKK